MQNVNSVLIIYQLLSQSQFITWVIDCV